MKTQNLRNRQAKADRNYRLRVGRLRALLVKPYDRDELRLLPIIGYYPAHPYLFSVRELADAIGSSPKVIRKAVAKGMIKSVRLPRKRARKLFFQIAAIRRFLADRNYTLCAGGGPLGAMNPDARITLKELRSEKIALNPYFGRGDAITIERTMSELGLSRRRVQDYLRLGDLKRIRCGHRSVLITRKSVTRLYRRRLRAAERQFEAARSRLERIKGIRCAG